MRGVFHFILLSLYFSIIVDSKSSKNNPRTHESLSKGNTGGHAVKPSAPVVKPPKPPKVVVKPKPPKVVIKPKPPKVVVKPPHVVVKPPAVVVYPPAVIVQPNPPAVIVPPKPSDTGSSKKEIAKAIGKALVKVGKEAYKKYKEHKQREALKVTQKPAVVFDFNNPRRTTTSTTTTTTTTTTTPPTTTPSSPTLTSANVTTTPKTIDPMMGNFTVDDLRNGTMENIPMNSNLTLISNITGNANATDPLEVFIPFNTNDDEIVIPLNGE